VAWTINVANSKDARFKFRHATDVLSLADKAVELRGARTVRQEGRARSAIGPECVKNVEISFAKPANQKCDEWVTYAHKVDGEDAMIGLESMKDWDSMCSDGQQPPA